MTREEVIKELENMKKFNYTLAPLEVFDMAIKALWAVEHMPTTKNDLGVDCISRKSIKQKLQEHHDFFVNAYGGFSNLPQNDKSRVDEITNCIAMVVNEPSVTPQEPKWIPVSEKLPNDRDWYLGIFREPDTGWINPLPFICDYVGSETKATTKEHWILRGFTDRDVRDCDYYFNLECVAWMPLPKAYSEVEE